MADKSGKVTHYRVSREWAAEGKRNGEFILRMKPEEKRYATLGELLQGACKELKLRSPISASSIPGSVQSRWLATKEARYDDRSVRVQEVFLAAPTAVC